MNRLRARRLALPALFALVSCQGQGGPPTLAAPGSPEPASSPAIAGALAPSQATPAVRAAATGMVVTSLDRGGRPSFAWAAGNAAAIGVLKLRA